MGDGYDLMCSGMVFLAGALMGMAIDLGVYVIGKQPKVTSIELTRENNDSYQDLKVTFSDGKTRSILGNSEGITLPHDILRRAHLEGMVLIKPPTQIQVLEANVKEVNVNEEQ